jgi:hypothetical protein
MMTATTDKDWLAIPARVRDLYIKHAGEAQDIFTGKREIPLIVTEVGPVVLYKEAGWPFVQARAAWDAPGKLIGGHVPVTSAVLGGALTAGAGYGTGWLLEKLFPEKYMKRGPLKRNLAIAGGLLGGLGAGYLHGKPLMEDHGVKGLFMRGPIKARVADHPPPIGTKRPDVWDAVLAQHPPGKTAEDTFLKRAAEKLQVEFEEDELYKTAYENMAGTMLPRIPKDEFNQMVMRDPYASMAIRAGTVGLTEAASQSKGGVSLISPFDIGRVAVGMGSGLVSGMLVGKALGALAGLTPEAQKGLQRAGLMAGFLQNIVPRAFGG